MDTPKLWSIDTNGSGFFDPGNAFSNHIAATISGNGISINNVTYNNPTNISLNISVATNASSGTRTVIVTNPDGQTVASAPGVLTVINGTNHPPILSPISDKTIYEGTTLTFTNVATDTDGDALAFSLNTGAPMSATINATNGIFTWTPTAAQCPSTNLITVRVTDNGVPPLSATQSFTVTVVPLPIESVSITNGIITITWGAIAGQVYQLQFKTNLTDAVWMTLTNVMANGPTANATNVMNAGATRFYRVLLIQ